MYIVMPTTDELRYLADFKTHCTLKVWLDSLYGMYTCALQHHACYISFCRVLNQTGDHDVQVDLALAKAAHGDLTIVTYSRPSEEAPRHGDSAHYGQQKNYGSKGYIEALSECNFCAIFMVARVFPKVNSLKQHCMPI